MNANRVSMVYPKAGEIEHWTYINEGGGWDHPIHLHFEEGITMNRGSGVIPATEKLVRKDVWRLRPSGQVQFQIQFGEYGGSYVNHCHNTVHEDFALLMRIQLLDRRDGLTANGRDRIRRTRRRMACSSPRRRSCPKAIPPSGRICSISRPLAAAPPRRAEFTLGECWRSCCPLPQQAVRDSVLSEREHACPWHPLIPNALKNRTETRGFQGCSGPPQPVFSRIPRAAHGKLS